MSMRPDSSSVSRLYEAAVAYRDADCDESRILTLKEYEDACEPFLDVDILPRMVFVYMKWLDIPPSKTGLPNV